MENFLSDQSKFQKIALKDDTFLNFIISQEKRIDKIYKRFVDSNLMSEETRKHRKLVGILAKCIKKVSMALHLSDQFYLLYEHLHTSLQSI